MFTVKVTWTISPSRNSVEGTSSLKVVNIGLNKNKHIWACLAQVKIPDNIILSVCQIFSQASLQSACQIHATAEGQAFRGRYKMWRRKQPVAKLQQHMTSNDEWIPLSQCPWWKIMVEPHMQFVQNIDVGSKLSRRHWIRIFIFWAKIDDEYVKDIK